MTYVLVYKKKLRGRGIPDKDEATALPGANDYNEKVLVKTISEAIESKKPHMTIKTKKSKPKYIDTSKLSTT